jgi:tetratricopeptide (TPR) repeat protein
MRIYKNILYLICLSAVLLGLTGCADLARNMSAPPLALSGKDEARVGAAVEVKLIQMLGGPYYDKNITADLKRLCRRQVQSPHTCKITVADRSAPALYPLPGGRAILSRGLLAEISSRAELKELLASAAKLSENAYDDRATRAMNEALKEFLSNPDSQYDPDSADLRLARHFEQTPCEQSCIDSIGRSGTYRSDPLTLPDSIKRLTELRPGYELLVRARAFEKAEDQARAIATYLQAATEAPDEPRILGALGLAYLRAGQLQSARLHLQKAVKLQPDYYRTRMGLGYLYLQSGKIRKANQSLAESVRLLPVTENLFLLAEAREKSGDIEGASLLYRLIVESDSNSKLRRTSARRLAEATGKQ